MAFIVSHVSFLRSDALNLHSTSTCFTGIEDHSKSKHPCSCFVALPRKIPFLNGFSKRLKGTSVLLPLGETNGLHPICKGPPTCEMFTGPRAFKTCWTSWVTRFKSELDVGHNDEEKMCFPVFFLAICWKSISYPEISTSWSQLSTPIILVSSVDTTRWDPFWVDFGCW